MLILRCELRGNQQSIAIPLPVEPRRAGRNTRAAGCAEHSVRSLDMLLLRGALRGNQQSIAIPIPVEPCRVGRKTRATECPEHSVRSVEIAECGASLAEHQGVYQPLTSSRSIRRTIILDQAGQL